MSTASAPVGRQRQQRRDEGAAAALHLRAVDAGWRQRDALLRHQRLEDGGEFAWPVGDTGRIEVVGQRLAEDDLAFVRGGRVRGMGEQSAAHRRRKIVTHARASRVRPAVPVGPCAHECIRYGRAWPSAPPVSGGDGQLGTFSSGHGRNRTLFPSAEARIGAGQLGDEIRSLTTSTSQFHAEAS